MKKLLFKIDGYNQYNQPFTMYVVASTFEDAVDFVKKWWRPVILIEKVERQYFEVYV